MARYFSALRLETEAVLSAFEMEPIEVSSIYIGGGTPSLCNPDLIEEWIAQVSAYAVFLPGFEFTVEANPESLTEQFARRMFNAGANRVVIGAQSFNVAALKKIGRKQKIKDIYQAFYFARMAGFDNIGADLIFGLPGQTDRLLRSDIDRLISLEPKHISFYQLTVEADTALEKNIASGKVIVPDEDKCADFYRLGSHLLSDHKYLRYEVSNFALDGFACRHNIAYWDGHPYLAFGPAAHGFIHNQRFGNVKDVNQYVEMIEAGKLPVAFVESLEDRDRLIEVVMLSLRTAEGLNKEKLIRAFGEPALAIVESAAASRYIRSGHLVNDDGVLKLTDRGFLVADKIIFDLVS